MKKVLIIEDDAPFAERLKAQLGNTYQIELCPDGQSGFYAIYEFKPDAVLLDVTIAEMDAASLVGKMRVQKQFQKLPIFILGDANCLSRTDDALGAGGTEVFFKDERDALDLLITALNNAMSPALARRPAVAQPHAAAVRAYAAPVYAAPTTIHQSNHLTTAVAVAEEPRIATTFSSRSGTTPVEGVPSIEHLVSRTPFRTSILPPEPELADAELTAFPETHAFLDTYGQQAHSIRQEFIRYRNATEQDRFDHLEELLDRISRMKMEANRCRLTGLSGYLSVIQSRLEQLRESSESCSPASLQGIATALDILTGLNNHLVEIGPLNHLQPLALVVDDEDESNRALCQGLENVRIKTTAVDNPDSALLEAEAKPFDLIFLDVDLPKMNGFALCARIRIIPIHRKTPVLFATALNDIKSRASSRVSGGNGFITKPINESELGLNAWSLAIGRRMLQNGAVTRT